MGDDKVDPEVAYEIARQAAIQATQEIMNNQNNNNVSNNTNSVEGMFGLDSKTFKGMENMLGFVDAIKKMSANPLQTAIESKVGVVAAGMVEDAFSPQQPKKSEGFLNDILNSNFAFGLGQGMGANSDAASVLETLTGIMGNKEKKQISNNAMNNVKDPLNNSQSNTSSDVEMLLSLDPNNPEHVAAYAESQGNLSIDVARKMLMIHQDDILNTMKRNKGNQAQSQYQQEIQYQQEPQYQHEQSITQIDIGKDKIINEMTDIIKNNNEIMTTFIEELTNMKKEMANIVKNNNTKSNDTKSNDTKSDDTKSDDIKSDDIKIVPIDISNINNNNSPVFDNNKYNSEDIIVNRDITHVIDKDDI